MIVEVGALSLAQCVRARRPFPCGRGTVVGCRGWRTWTTRCQRAGSSTNRRCSLSVAYGSLILEVTCQKEPAVLICICLCRFVEKGYLSLWATRYPMLPLLSWPAASVWCRKSHPCAFVILKLETCVLVLVLMIAGCWKGAPVGIICTVSRTLGWVPHILSTTPAAGRHGPGATTFKRVPGPL